MPSKRRTWAGTSAVTQSKPAVRTTAIMFVSVFVGGAAGSLLREAFAAQIPGASVLTATFGINVVACFVLGWLYAIRHRVHAHVLHLGAVGFCGGLSTFSSFVAELNRMAASNIWNALTAASLEIAVGLAAAVLGEAIGRRMWRPQQ